MDESDKIKEDKMGGAGIERRLGVLYRWILQGCAALMLPVTCAVINYVINKNLIERKINQINDFMIRNASYSIEDRLNEVMETARSYLLNPEFALYGFGGYEDLKSQKKGYSSAMRSFTQENALKACFYKRFSV